MSSLLDKNNLKKAVERVKSLQENDNAQFGKFTPAKMVCHLIDSLEISYGLKGEQKAKKSFFTSALGKWLIIASPVPWPKGKIESPFPIFLETQPSESFEKDKETLIELIRKMEQPDSISWTESPGFGKLSPKQWVQLHGRHLNHHLEQFGR